MQYVLGIALSFTLLAPAAWASEPEGPVQEPDRVAYQKKTLVSFSEVRVSGEIVKPSDSFILVRKNVQFRSLIRIRADFRPELLASTDAL